MTSATTMPGPMPGFQPLDTLVTGRSVVEFQLRDGSVVAGWMIMYSSGRVYVLRAGTRLEYLHPVAWRPLSLPIAQRNAA
ncbi:MAG: hypothetical protein ABL901_01105 [Hyphomicrobiaceae bacterium]